MGILTLWLVVALSVGLGAGLTIPHHRHHSTTICASSAVASSTAASSTAASFTVASSTAASSTADTSTSVSASTISSSSSSSSTPTTSTGTTLTGIWQPESGATWNIQLDTPLSNTPSKGNFDVWDIDLFDSSVETISSLKQQGAKVMCYFSAGSYENWRPDASNFSESDMGNDLSGWAGETWINIASPDIRLIMEERIQLAAQKGCDGVDPDNVDGYNNDNGLGLTQADSIDYLQFLASKAHPLDLAIGLKNAGEIISSVIDTMQWSVNEQCIEYNECDTFEPFISQGKPVFHVEYPKGSDSNNNAAVSSSAVDNACDSSSVSGFSTIIKNMDLDSWVQTC